jgi:tetratricopeptide (TPR) repeat protein
MKSFLCDLILSCVVVAGSGKPIDELTYGSILYAYHQQEYEQAMLETSIAEAQGTRGENALRFDLAHGSFAFSQGMYTYAQNLFASVAEDELTDLDRMRLAFHLAREYHRQQNWPAVFEQIDQIDLGTSWRGKDRHHPEVEYMRLEGLIAEGNLTDARAVLANIDDRHPLHAYASFNLGVALREADDRPAALDVFRTLAMRTPRDRESFDLTQRARLAMAVLARELDQVSDAKTLLRELPGEGRYQNVALASYGDVAMAQGEHELAARIWLTISKDPSWTNATSAARLKFPLSLEHMASRETALEYYRDAEADFAERLQYVNDMASNIGNREWLRTTLAVFSAPQKNASSVDEMMNVWQIRLGHTDWLEWLSGEAVHEVLREWRELEDRRVWLEGLPERLEILEEVAEELQHRRGRVNDALSEHGLGSRLASLQTRIGETTERIASISASEPSFEDQWMYTLADPDQRALLNDLRSKRDLIRTGMAEADQERYLARLDRIRGLVFWEITQQRAGRLRALQKSLAELEATARDAQTQITRLSDAEGVFASGVQTDFYGFVDRAQAMTMRIARAQSVREERLAIELKRGMQKETHALEQYLLATRIAIARASDQLAMEGGP